MTKPEPVEKAAQVTKLPEEWGKSYGENFKLYQDFTTKLRDLLKELLNWEEIEIANIEWRTKSIESFLEKIRKSGKYANPLLEVTDLVGIRLIAYYKEDVDKIGTLIEREFKIDKENSIDKSDTLDPDKFGYISVHYVVSLSPPRNGLTEWKIFSDLKAEIQVRTVLQHAWSAIDHTLRYKNTIDVPRPLRRQLFRLSALLELADEEFSDLRKRTEDIQEHYALEVTKGELDLEINLNSLDAYIQSKEILTEWTAIAEGVGCRPWAGYTGPLPKSFRGDSLSELVEILKILNIRKIEELDDLLEEANKWGKEALEKICKSASEKGFIPWAYDLDVITFLVLYAKRKNLADVVNTLHYVAPIISAFKEIS